MSRIFWLGMHKVLKPTELRTLRSLNIEVFNPSYISPIYDQSADLTIDYDQPTTLPPDVFLRLLAYDFFYKPISADISEILNAYFDTVIVTISADWLKAVAAVFRGKIIFRTYGQHFSMSEKIIDIGLFRPLLERDDMFIVPFAQETVEMEHRWFADLVFASVPYQIPDDVFARGTCWGHDGLRKEIATSIPNIQNPYFAENYSRFARTFPESIFSIFGPQRSAPADRRIVGALSRQDFLTRLSTSMGYYYNYNDNVCYLPPIEMMQMGGPVVCAQGSLLARFLGAKSPNVAATPDDAKAKLKRLMSDEGGGWSRELIAAQESTRARYDRENVVAAFRAAFSRLLALDKPAAFETDRLELRTRPDGRSFKRHIAILMHLDGLFGWVQGAAYAFEGIPRVVDAIVRVITAGGDTCVTLTTTASSLPLVVDFFAAPIAAGHLRIRVLPSCDASDSIAQLKAKLLLMIDLDKDHTIQQVLVPHYYAFPEALALRSTDTTIYLPDYFPHLFPGVVFDSSAQKDEENKKVGVALARRCKSILTNSSFTRNYLSAAGFVDQKDIGKVVVAPLPFLGEGRASDLDRGEKDTLFREIGTRPFLFYPTANRPNKQIAFLLELFAQIKLQHPDLLLVLTCSLWSVPAAGEAAGRLRLGDDLVMLPRCSESVLSWLYEHCEALCLTSTMEGNFPPQMLEALRYGAPIVATRLPTVTELLKEHASLLHLCRPLDLDDFAATVSTVLGDRAAVLARQARVSNLLREWNSAERFSERLDEVFPQQKVERRSLEEVN